MKKILFLISVLMLFASFAIESAPLAIISISGIVYAGMMVSSVRDMGVAYSGVGQIVNAYIYRFMSPEAQGMQEQPPLTRCEKFLFDYLRTKGNQVTVAALDVNALKFDPITYYVRYAITGLSGKQKFLGQATTDVTGVSNFAVNGVLQQYYNFAFDRIAVAYAVDNTAAAAVYNSNGFTSVRGSVAAGLGNGEMEIYANKNLVFGSTPVCDMLAEAATTGGGIGDFSGASLHEPIIFPENVQLEGYVDFPVAIPSVANTTYVMEVRFYGVQARMRA